MAPLYYADEPMRDRDGDYFGFVADGLRVEVFSVQRGLNDGADGWAWCITYEEGGLPHSRPKTLYALLDIALFEAWTTFAELVRAMATGTPFMLTKKRFLESYAILSDAFGVEKEKHDAARAH
jgi:hypothetical protein